MRVIMRPTGWLRKFFPDQRPIESDQDFLGRTISLGEFTPTPRSQHGPRPGGARPPQDVIDLAINFSTLSPCRSKRGAVATFPYMSERIAAYNSKPDGVACDGSAECKSRCGVEAVHAEQKVLLMGVFPRGATMVHVKTEDGKLVPSGGPSCVECSKLMLHAGVEAMWLFHESGWRKYPMEDFHRLSLEARRAKDGDA